jgi:hypothetical protein
MRLVIFRWSETPGKTISKNPNNHYFERIAAENEFSNTHRGKIHSGESVVGIIYQF